MRSSTHYRWTVSRDSMVHEQHPGGECDRFDGGGAGRVGRLGALDQDRVPAAAAGTDRVAGGRGHGDAGDCADGRLHHRDGEQVAGAVRRATPGRAPRKPPTGGRTTPPGPRLPATSPTAPSTPAPRLRTRA